MKKIRYVVLIAMIVGFMYGGVSCVDKKVETVV